MIQILRATESDVSSMHAVQLRAFAEEGRRSGAHLLPPLQEQPESILHHVRTQLAFVAKEGNTIVGCIRGLLDGNTCTVRALSVEPSHHGKGIGSALLHALEAEIGHGQRVELTTNTVMENNVPFYERHGYRVYARTEPIPGIKLAHLSK